MKYKYYSGRSVTPNGNKSPTLACYECGKPQSWSYRTENQKNICCSCRSKDERSKDEKGLLEKDN